MTRLFGRNAVGSYAHSATVRGLASVFDLTGNTTRQHHWYATPAEADRAALQDDWAQVGDSIREVAEGYRTQR